MKIDIPGFGACDIENLLLDYNGTIAFEGSIIEGVKERLRELSKELRIYIVTADTYGTVKEQVADLPVNLAVIDRTDEMEAKAKIVRALGTECTIAIGNGNNDESMLKEAVMGMCICQNEGCSVKSLLAADIMFNSINHALDSIISNNKIVATLRF